MFMLLVTTLIWGSTYVVTKEVVETLPPLTLAFARVAIAAIVLLPFAIIRRRRREAALALPWRVVASLGFVGVALYYALFNVALAHTSASQGALVQSCIPAITALVALSWLRERATGRRWWGIALSVLGVAVVFAGAPGGTQGSASLGNALMFASVICWGVYTSLAKRAANMDAVAVTFGATAAAALMLAPAAAFELAWAGVPRLDAAAWMGVLYLGAGASGLAYLLYNAALRYMDAGQAGVYMNLVPVIGVVSGVVALGEPLSRRALFGGALVLTGVWVTSTSRRPGGSR